MDADPPLLVTVGPSGRLLRDAGLPVRLVEPVAAGQLVHHRETGARAVLILDGYFQQRQAVTLSEIRESIRSGLTVLGGTSMGALRAVEAGPVGMHGVGGIFRQVRDGHLTDDADLALTFLDDGTPLSVPQVDVVHLCRLLRTLGERPEVCDAIVRRSAALWFPERTLDALARIAEDVTGGPVSLAAALLTPDARALWDLKSWDALASVHEALRVLAGGPSADPAAGPVPAEPSALLGDRVTEPA